MPTRTPPTATLTCDNHTCAPTGTQRPDALHAAHTTPLSVRHPRKADVVGHASRHWSVEFDSSRISYRRRRRDRTQQPAYNNVFWVFLSVFLGSWRSERYHRTGTGLEKGLAGGNKEEEGVDKDEEGIEASWERDGVLGQTALGGEAGGRGGVPR
ncbi:hypothetical protein DFP73DRAFT_598194 [Morchella snyderi]|nr:hypothetical protein DFP73DRAFT_598194 [Morchella snyderi]